MTRLCLRIAAISIVYILLSYNALHAEDATQPATRREATRFPEVISNVVRLSDGSAACASQNRSSLFLSGESLYDWAEVRLESPSFPKYPIFTPIGGTRELILLRVLHLPDDAFLFSVNRTGTVRKLRQLPSQAVAFADQEVGAFAEGNSLEVTVDRGDHWIKFGPVVEAGKSDIRSLGWADKQKLLVGSTNGVIQMFECNREGKLERRWSSKAADNGVQHMVVDRDVVWVGDANLRGLKLSSGTQVATVAPDFPVNDMAVVHSTPLLWNIKSLSIWHSRSGNEQYELRQTLETPFLAGVLALPDGKALAIATSGQALLLDLKELKSSVVDLRVAALPTNMNDAPSPEDFRALRELEKRVPPDRRQEILSEMRKLKDVTIKQRVDWAMEQYKKAIAEAPATRDAGKGNP